MKAQINNTTKKYFMAATLCRVGAGAIAINLCLSPLAALAEVKDLLGPPGQVKDQYNEPNDEPSSDLAGELARKQIEDAIRQLRNEPTPLPSPKIDTKPTPVPANPNYDKKESEILDEIEQINRKTYPFLYNQGSGIQVNHSPNIP
jgi:hypothetical protein